MNIRDWPLGSIMQLPDCCFGRRFIVSCAFHRTVPASGSEISVLAFPERAVIWGLHIKAGSIALLDVAIRIALGDQLPATVGAFSVLEPLFPGLGVRGAAPQTIWVGAGSNLEMPELKMPVETHGRRLCVELINGPTACLNVEVAVVVSSVPTEVPDWLISGYHRSQ